jgi:hypothetical protein
MLITLHIEFYKQRYNSWDYRTMGYHKLTYLICVCTTVEYKYGQK